MRTLLTILVISVFPLFLSNLSAQVKLKLNVTGQKSNTSAYVTAYAQKDKKTLTISQGRASLELIRYEQYIVMVYQKGRKPFAMSLDTEKAPRELTVNVNLKQGTVEQEDYSPALHYKGRGGRYAARAFDLDEVSDKPKCGALMQEANEEIRKFYAKGSMPRITKSRSGFKDDSAMRKTEHQIGQDIYKLLGKKRALELDLERLNEIGAKEIFPDASPQTKKDACSHNLKILRREKQFYEVSYKLAQSELDKVEVAMNKAVKKGLDSPGKELAKSRKKLEMARQLFEAADLNYKNKKADCWELELRLDLEQTLDSKEKALLEIEINNVRLYQRKQNAKRLYSIHNKMAMDVTERDRQVQLAKAQKFVSDHAKARVAITQNKLKKLMIKDNGTGSQKSQLGIMRRELVKNEELAFQAEMGYLEHMWHLRTVKDLDGDFVDDLFLRQSKLYDLEKLPDRNKPEDFVEGYDPNSSIMEQAEALFNSFVELNEKEDDRGKVQEVEFKDDYYEIVVSPNGAKSYYKNNKPITSLTYRFETIKKFGEFLQNIRIEEEKRKRFLDFFRKRTEF